MKSKKVSFKNEEGIELIGRLEFPLDQKPRYFAILAHCFTCGKDLKAERKLSLALSQEGFAVLRFDFTGLGQSGGDFSESNFSSNVGDLLAAADFLKQEYRAASLMIGHSLGGTAALMAAAKIPSVKAVASVAAPADPEHVLKHFEDELDTIEADGSARVKLAGREFCIRKQFIDDLKSKGLEEIFQSDDYRGKSLLVMHSPQDTTVGISNAAMIFEMANHPKSFVSLDGADHLLSQSGDASYVGQLVGSWAIRYLGEDQKAPLETHEEVVARLSEGPFLTELKAGPHHLLADEPEEAGGDELGPTPYEYLAGGLGACTAMTLKLYARRKEWPLEEVRVHLSYDSDYTQDCLNCEDDEQRIGRFTRLIELEGELSDEQRQRLLEIAEKCPVHKTLSRGVHVESKLADSSS